MKIHSQILKDQEKRTKKIKRQIKNIPLNAIYICMTSLDVKIYQNIALENKRTDIKFIPLTEVSSDLFQHRRFIILNPEVNQDQIHPEVYKNIDFHNYVIKDLMEGNKNGNALGKT